MELFIEQKIDSIAECIFTRIQNQQDESYGLYSGAFGQLLFLFYYSRYSKVKKHMIQTEKYAKRLMNQFLEKEKLHTFCSGFSGILYLFEFLRENDFIDIDVSHVQPLMDNYIASKMRWDIQQQNYDFMHGALGVGLYFLKKRSNPEHIYIYELIDFLYNTAEKDDENKIFKWRSIIGTERNLIGYNLSLSHGISSIIIFLSRVIKNGIFDEKIVDMLFGAVNYLLLQEKDFSQFGSCFPNYILIDSPKEISKSRLAWCYGDLGIGIALWQAGNTLEKIEWKAKGLEILLQSVKRRDFNDNFVIDAGICHGSAGISLIFRRMFFETQRDEFNEANLYWINQTLGFSSFRDGLVGYKAFVKDGWECNYSLLMGISGIGLVLLSYLENNQQTWDEMFLLS